MNKLMNSLVLLMNDPYRIGTNGGLISNETSEILCMA